MKDIAIVGFGYVGSVVAIYLAKCGFTIIGIDTNLQTVKRINSAEPSIREPDAHQTLIELIKSNKIRATNKMDVIESTQTIIITVGTPIDDSNTADMDALQDACKNIGHHIKPGHLVILKSTVNPGVTEELVKTILEETSGLTVEDDFFLAYCPERIAEGSNIQNKMGSALEEFVSLPVIVGGIGPKSKKAATDFWESVALKVIPVSDSKTAEFVKVASNWWIDLNIAMANEMGMLAEKIGVDSLEVIKAANSIPKGDGYVNILYPGAGVGGSCLPKDPWFVYQIATSLGLELQTPRLSRKINDQMPLHMFNLVNEVMDHLGKKLINSTIAILGLAYKGSTHDIRNTPAKPLIKLLSDAGASIVAYDPWVYSEEVSREIGLTLSNSIEDAFKGADCIITITPHPEFFSLNMNDIAKCVNDPCGIVDGRRIFDPIEAEEKGFHYRAVGLGKSTLRV